jgi:hypothetical protein
MNLYTVQLRCRERSMQAIDNSLVIEAPTPDAGNGQKSFAEFKLPICNHRHFHTTPSLPVPYLNLRRSGFHQVTWT